MVRPAPLMATIRPELVRGELVDRAADRPPVPIPPTASMSSYALAALLGLDIPTTTVAVTDNTICGLPGIQSGVDMIAHAVATMMTEANVYDEDGNQIDTPPIVSRPTRLMGSYEFWTALVDCLMKRGNAPSIHADFDTDGLPRQVVPAHPDAVSFDDSKGIPRYTIGSAVYEWDEICHVRHGAPWGSLWGQGIIERYRNEVSRQLHEQEYGRMSLSTGGVPSAIIQLDKPKVTTEEAEEVQDNWIEKHGGGQRKPAVIGRALSITPLSWKPEDMEWVESRRVSIAEAALICGLHPADLGASFGGSLDYANITERQLARILQSFMPWMTLCEQAWSDMIPDGQFVRGDVSALLRSSEKERLEVLEIGQRLGIYTTEELREMEKRPKLPVKPEPKVELTDPPAPKLEVVAS